MDKIKNSKTSISTLVVGGGGMKCVASIGALLILQKQDILKNITKYAGTSSGSIIITLLVMGYTPQEINDTVFSQGSSIVKDSIFKIPFNLIGSYGLYSANKMYTYLQSLFVNKNFDKDITFIELFNKTNKIITITGTSLNTRNTYFFNHKTYPDMKVIDAVRISISIPMYFTTVNYKIDNVYHKWCDGGVLLNYPMYYYDICEKENKYIKTFNELSMIKNKQKYQLNTSLQNYQYNTIGIMVISRNNNRDEYNYFTGFDKIDSISQFIEAFFNTILDKIEKDNFYNPITGIKSNFFNRTISINIDNSISPINFDLSNNIKQNLLVLGKNSALNFFKDNYPHYV